jgi:hypothetical protein
VLKREIKYEDYDGEETSEIAYFNLSKPELIELDVEYGEGFGRVLERVIETKDNKEIIRLFKKIILMAYGKKSDDGKRFIKNDQLREEFSQTAAYSALFMELATDDEVAVKFLTGLLPSDMREGVQESYTKTAALATET